MDEVEGVADYLKSNGYGFKESLRIQSQFLQKKNILKQQQLVLELIEEITTVESLNNAFKRSILLKRTKTIKSRFWRRIIELPIAMAAKNTAWVKKLKKNLCQESPYYPDIRGWNFKEKDRELIRNYFLFVLKSYSEILGRDEELRILSEKLSLYGGTNDFKTIGSRYDADWSLAELRESFKNPYLRNRYFDFYFLVLMNRTSSTELVQRIRESISENVLKRAKNSQYWIFEYFFPADKRMREIILTKLNNQWEERDYTYRFHILKILSNSVVKKGLSQKNPIFNRATFQIERQFYTELLSSGEASHYAFYELSKLGDKSSNHLWWLIF